MKSSSETWGDLERVHNFEKQSRPGLGLGVLRGFIDWPIGKDSTGPKEKGQDKKYPGNRTRVQREIKRGGK